MERTTVNPVRTSHAPKDQPPGGSSSGPFALAPQIPYVPLLSHGFSPSASPVDRSREDAALGGLGACRSFHRFDSYQGDAV